MLIYFDFFNRPFQIQKYFVYEENHQKGRNIYTFHLILIFLVIFIPYEC